MARLLLDTHVALWLLAGQPIDQRAHQAAVDPANDVYLSIASPWEIAIKQAVGRLELRDDYLDLLLDQGVGLLGIEPSHTRAVRGLPHHHRDPFDRMLVAQAQVEGLMLVTRDARLREYDVGLLPA